MESRRKKWTRALLGRSPRAIAFVLAPTALAIALDLGLRARVLVEYPAFEAVNYLGAVLLSAGFWGGPLWLSSRLFVRKSRASRVGLAILYGLLVLPVAAFAFGGQALHYRVFHSYMARDTVRLGIALRGTVGEWLSQLGGAASFVAIAAGGAIVTALFALAARRAAPALATSRPWVPLGGFAIAFGCLFFDLVESRALQSATPDACFAHGLVHALRDGVTGKGWVRRGVSVRTPAPLPPLPRAAARPNVLLIVTESVRADAMCSAPPPACEARFLDAVIPDRQPLGKLTTQSPGTLSGCMLFWTGLPPNAGFATSHRAPTLWEVARAVGYRTVYVTSQNMHYEDFGLFVERAGIDVRVSADDLGDLRSQQIGAPDERASDRMLAELSKMGDAPWFAVLHFSNTHAPYRVDPDLQPFTPHATDPLGDVEAFHNHYRNSVLLQERTLASFLRHVKRDGNVILFVSDHGEQFREHGGLYHIHTLFEEEVRVPGFIVGVPEERRAAVATYATRRTYSQDVHATILDLFGVLEARGSMPFGSLLKGRSLLRPAEEGDPTAILSTATGVWEPDVFREGVMRGDSLLVGTPTGGGWACYKLAGDPGEQDPLPPSACGSLVDAAWRAFPGADVR